MGKVWVLVAARTHWWHGGLNKKKEERREDRKFVALPPETVQLVAETSGLSNLQPTVAAALSEDASYRARELAHVRVGEESERSIFTHSLHVAFLLADLQPTDAPQQAQAARLQRLEPRP